MGDEAPGGLIGVFRRSSDFFHRAEVKRKSNRGMALRLGIAFKRRFYVFFAPIQAGRTGDNGHTFFAF